MDWCHYYPTEDIRIDEKIRSNVFLVVVCHQIIELCVVYLTIAIHIRLVQKPLNTKLDMTHF